MSLLGYIKRVIEYDLLLDYGSEGSLWSPSEKIDFVFGLVHKDIITYNINHHHEFETTRFCHGVYESD
jgi:hypothetical protein